MQHRALQASNLFNDRQIIWQAALNLLREQPRFLLTGTTMALSSGLTNAMIPAGVYAGPDFVHVHSIYLQTLVAWGIPGFALLAAGLLAFAGAAWRVMVRHGGLSLWERLAPVPVLYVVLCETVDCFTRLAEDSPLLLFACVFAGWTLQLDASARRRAYLAKPARGAVDVIIPVYNAADYVARAALSALEAGAARVILVDDGSTDGSGAVCDRLAEDRRIVALHQENRGAAAARNAGLAAADAEYVAFLDADDRLLPGALTALLERMGDAQMIQGSIVRSDPEIYRKYPAEVLTGREALSRSLSDPTRLLLCHGWLFRRDLLTDRFDETLTLGEDGEWMLRVLRGTDKAALTEMPVYRYTVRADSALRSHTGAAAAYLQTLERTATTLEALKMPQETALYRLTHLLLMLTHDAAADGRTLREAAPFAADFERVRLQGFSPRMVTLRLLRRRAYPAVHLALRCRRIVNRIYGMHGKS